MLVHLALDRFLSFREESGLIKGFQKQPDNLSGYILPARLFQDERYGAIDTSNVLITSKPHALALPSPFLQTYILSIRLSPFWLVLCRVVFFKLYMTSQGVTTPPS